MQILLESVSDIDQASSTETHPDELDKLSHHTDIAVLNGVSSNVMTKPETLGRLLNHENDDVSKNAAGNGNLGIAHYKNAFRKHPKDALENPSVLLNMLENPNVIKEHGFEQEYTDAVLAHGNAEQKEYVMNEFKHNVAKSPYVSPNILYTFANDKNHYIRSSVAGNINTTPEILMYLAHDPKWSIRKTVASHVNATPPILSHLSKDPDFEVRDAIATNPNTSDALLLDLAKNGDISTKIKLMSSPHLSSKVLNHLSKDELGFVRSEVAKHPNVTTDILRYLSNDTDQDTKQLATSILKTFKQ